jgi:MraZ protein
VERQYSGEYPNTLDDKGRVSIPAKLREKLPGNLLILTKGIERFVWLLPPEQWEKVSKTLMDTNSLSLQKASMVHHRFIAPAQEVEVDRVGRIAIPQSLRDYAGLSRDCVVIGNGKGLEIWDAEQYRAYEKAIDDNLMDVMEEMGPIDLFS